MSAPKVDISRLSPEERLALVDELWDSLDSREVPLTAARSAELKRREAVHDANPHPGRPWREALDEIEQRRG